MIVSPILATALEDALRAAAATGGLFDPTIAAALEAAGYDRTFSEIEQGPVREPVPAGRWREIELVGSLVRRPVGLRLDLKASSRGAPSMTLWRSSKGTASSQRAATSQPEEISPSRSRTAIP